MFNFDSNMFYNYCLHEINPFWDKKKSYVNILHPFLGKRKHWRAFLQARESCCGLFFFSISSQMLSYNNIFNIKGKYVVSDHWQMQQKILSLYFNPYFKLFLIHFFSKKSKYYSLR